MKPIKLKFTAFGPYPKAQVVDFTDLKSSNMFVITGPTGSGKTTIFDAISFALYGSASGSERGADMFRSDFADDTAQTEVEFEFEVRNKRYSIKRIPSQYRPKLRGEGMRKIDASVSLKTEESVYTSQAEVSEQIETILGLTKDQFKQIVLLPQGEFKKLLVSDSRSKEKIFRKIFNTSTIKQIQEKMRIETEELKRKIEDAELQIATLLNSYSSITSSLGLKRLETNINTNLKDVQKQTSALQVDIANFTEMLKLEADNELMTKQLEEHRSRLTALDSNRDKFKLKNDFISSLKPTIEYDNLKREITVIQQNIKVNKGKLDAFKQRLSKLTESSTEACYKRAKLEYDNVEQHQLLKAELEKKLDKVKEYKEKQRVIHTYAKRMEDAKVSLGQLEAIKVELEQEQKQIKSNIELLQNLDLERKNLDLEKQKLKKLTQVAADIKDINDKLQASYGQAQALNEQYNAASHHLSTIRLGYLSAQAGNLAKTLKASEPCPVCGSLEHPAPAIKAELLIDLEDINKQEQLVADLNAELSNITSFIDVNKALTSQLTREYQIEDIDYCTNYKNICAQVTSLEDKINELATQSNLDVVDNKLATCISSIATLMSDIKGYEFTIDKLKAELETSGDQQLDEQVIAQELTAVNSKIQLITTNYNQFQEKFNAEIREKDNIATNIDFIEQAISGDNQRLKKLEESISNLIAKSGQEKLEQYSVMLADEVQIRKELEEYTQSVQLVKQKISELEDTIKKYNPIDVSAVQEQLKVVENEYQQFSSIEESYKILSSKVKDDLEQLLKIESKSKADINRYQIIADASDIANGKTISKISFERYMLSIYFKQIITRANIYFKTMTNNRFLLQYKKPQGGRAAQGLDLNIIDNYTSKIRDVKSLSGGESFKAALAMALGLSDIVQMNAGGVQIDTIFIDEGFGSLDSDSLNTVIDTLIEIENEGRMVGIISHVEELKNQISNKIEIEPSPSGSNLKVNFN